MGSVPGVKVWPLIADVLVGGLAELLLYGVIGDVWPMPCENSCGSACKTTRPKVITRFSCICGFAGVNGVCGDWSTGRSALNRSIWSTAVGGKFDA